MTLPAYPKYKPSGVEWLGEIPEEWDVRRLKFSASAVGGGTPSTSNAEYWKGDIPWVSPKDMKRSLIDSTQDYITELAVAECATSIVKPDTVLVVVRSGILQHSIPVARNLVPVTLNQDMKGITVESSLIPAYLHYLFEGNQKQLLPLWSKQGCTVESIEFEMMMNAAIPHPSLSEQKAIADYLDRKTGQIDELIGKKKELIERLKEQRTALITAAVTGKLQSEIGIQQSALVDSGVEWLGQIPEHWEVRRLKFLAAEPLKYGANEAAELDDRELPRYIRITDVKEDGTLWDETFRSLPEDVAKPYLLEEGDILLARSGATVGKSFQYLESWGTAAFAGYLIRFRVDKMLLFPRYAYHFLRSDSYWNWINSSLIQATIQNVSAEKYANLILPLPSVKEQKEIANYLDHKTGQIDGLIGKAEEAIQCLEEYRTAIITAVVTGKIKVDAGSLSQAPEWLRASFVARAKEKE